MTLMEALSEHLVKGQQGQLVIKFNGDVHLCKILVEDGQAVHISHGRLAPELVIETLGSKTVEWTNFIAGYPVRKKVNFPLHEKLLAAVGERTAIPVAPATSSPEPKQEPVATPAATPAPDGPTVAAEKVAEVVETFIELIGPLGTILAEQAASAVNHTNGAPMPVSSYNGFILALAKEVPDDDRNAFLERYKN